MIRSPALRLSAPLEPLARARWLFLIGALASAAFATVLVVGATTTLPRRAAAGAAEIALLLVWHAGYRRASFPTLCPVLEGLLLAVIAAAGGEPFHAIGLFYMGINFRALYGTKRDALTVFTAYSLAFAAGEMFVGPPGRWVAMLPSAVVPQLFGFGLSATVIYALGQALARERSMADALRESEQRYHLLFENNALPMWMYELATLRIKEVNKAALEHYGYDRDEFLTMRISDLHPPERLPELEVMLGHLPADGSATHLVKHRLKDGRVADIEAIGRALGDSMPGMRIVLINDVTHRLAAERALRASEARFRTVAESLGEAILITDHTGAVLYASARAADVLGFPPARLLGRNADALLAPAPTPAPAPSPDVDGAGSALARSAARRPDAWQHERAFQRPDGTAVWLAISSRPFDDGQQREPGSLITIADITARHRAELELQTTNHTLHALIDLAPQAIVAVDLDWHVMRWNRAAERIFGWAAEEVIGGPLPVVPPDQLDTFREQQQAMIGDHGIRGVETKRMRKDGTGIDVHLSVAVLRDAAGTPVGNIAVINDITESKRLEAQLRQAQKMEAVGQLAGGVAHDFNNLLTSIRCATSALIDAMEPGDARRSDVVEIDEAATRAATLTRQLLAFSRKQVLQPAVLDPNALVTDLGKMLTRLLPESIHQRIALAARVGHVFADRGQLEQVIINLVVNARDAMPSGGTLTISTSEVEVTPETAPWRHEASSLAAGTYVVLSVADTGCGMDRATQERIFEPFFTTKPVGRGTGLGLATVYGIVRQSSGYVWVYSELGRGSVFKVYLPVTDSPLAATGVTRSPTDAARGSERILVVEDEAAVRAAVGRYLGNQGYAVLTAASAADALTILDERAEEIDLVLTDVVMPGLSGPALMEQLAKRVLPRGRRVRALYMSGYTRSHIAEADALGPGIELIEKPFTPAQLAERVRGVLDGAGE